MSIDLEQPLRSTARELAHLYAALDQAKYAQTRQPEVRTMRPAPGPRTPAPNHLISLDEELSARLMEMVGECRSHVSPTRILHKDGARLCAFVAWHAQLISELDVAEHLLEEMKDQARKIRFTLFGNAIAQVAKLPERRQSAQSICVRMSSMGHRITPDLLRKWAERGHITRENKPDGTAGYLATEVLDRITETR